MFKKILIIGANSEIALEFVKLLSNKDDLYFILSSKNFENLKYNYNYLKYKKFIKLDLTKPNTFKNFISILDKDIDLIISFAGYKETPEVNHIKIFKSNYLGLKLLIKSFIKKSLFGKLKIIACITSFVSDKKNFRSTTYSLSKHYLSNYLEKLKNDQIENLIIKNFKLGIINTRMNTNSKFYKLISSDKIYTAKILTKNLFNNKNVIFVPYIWKIVIRIYNLIPKKIIFFIDDIYKKISF